MTARRTSMSGWLLLAVIATGAAYGVTGDVATAITVLAVALVVGAIGLWWAARSSATR